MRIAIGPKRAPERADVPPSNGAPRITTWASAYVEGSSRSHIGTPRNVKSGPNCWPYRVILGVFARRDGGVKDLAATALATRPSDLGRGGVDIRVECDSDRPESSDRVDKGPGVLSRRPRRQL